MDTQQVCYFETRALSSYSSFRCGWFFSWHRFLILFAFFLINFTLVFGKTVSLKLISLLKSEVLHMYFSEEPDQKYP